MAVLQTQDQTLRIGVNVGSVIVGAYEAKQEAELTSLTDPRDNPFKYNKAHVISVGESRKFDRSGKTQRKKKSKEDLEQIRRH